VYIKKGDIVVVTSGKDKGKKGKILRSLPDQNKVVLEGINKAKKHQKPSRAIPQGGILQIEAPISASNVMYVCKKCNKPTRLGKKILDNQQKVQNIISRTTKIKIVIQKLVECSGLAHPGSYSSWKHHQRHSEDDGNNTGSVHFQG
jgi:large subunit ribosomal protein L24